MKNYRSQQSNIKNSVACLRFCPTGARTWIHEMLKASAQKRNDLFSERREPETFIEKFT